MTDEPPPSTPAAAAAPCVPALPPLGYPFEPSSQQIPAASAAAAPPAATHTPPPQTILGVAASCPHSQAASSISTLTPSTKKTKTPSRTATETPKRAATENPPFYDSPSPKKPAPDYEKPPSDDNSEFSGDDEDGWELEEERIMALILKQNREEEAIAEAQSVMSRMVWDPEVGAKVEMKFLRLNLIDDYNDNMNNVDIADQLRNCYRFNHWFRNRKWWWAIFLWALGVAATNAFVMYNKLYDEHKRLRKPVPRKKWNHLEFLIELIYDFMGWAPDDDEDEEEGDDATVATTRSQATAMESAAPIDGFNLGSLRGREDWQTQVKTDSVTRQRMESDFFRVRHDGEFHPSIPVIFDSGYCQYCRYKWHNVIQHSRTKENNKHMKNNRTWVKRCLKCNVNLCWECFNSWHGYTTPVMNHMVNK